MRLEDLPKFTFGLMIGAATVLIPTMHITAHKRNSTPVSQEKIENLEFYDEKLAQKLFDSEKVLCMITTTSKMHRERGDHIKSTWGKRCSRLIFISDEKDELLDVADLSVIGNRSSLWGETKDLFKYAYKNHLNEFDWFVKADDDSYIILENLRYLVAQYKPNTAFYLGHRFMNDVYQEGYMAGGGYILSRKALQKFQEKIVHNETQCRQEDSGTAEDLNMGRCLAHYAIFVDCRDERHQQRFFPLGVNEHLAKVETLNPNFWFTRNQYYYVAQGNLSCCSTTSIQYHYVFPQEMHFYDYLIYQVNVFGIDDHSKEVLPRKISLQEAIEASDAVVPHPDYRNHTDFHDLEDSEIY